MKETLGFLLTLISSVIIIILNELLKVSPIITGIIIISLFIFILIFAFGYYIRQIDNKIRKNSFKIREVNKDLNIDNRLTKIEKDIEWIKRGK